MQLLNDNEIMNKIKLLSDAFKKEFHNLRFEYAKEESLERGKIFKGIEINPVISEKVLTRTQLLKKYRG